MRRLPEAVYRAALFALPFALAFLYVVSLLPFLPYDQWWEIVVFGMGTYLVAPVGTEVIVPAVVLFLQSQGASLGVLVVAIVSIVLVDVFAALFVAWNWDLLERAPRLGPALRRVEDKCHAIIARRGWGEGATLTALATYVALPFQMTGGLFGSVLGRIMGIGKVRVFLAVTAGSLAGAVPMGIISIVAGPIVLAALQNPTAQTVGAAAGILITLAFIALVVALYRRGKRIADSR